ncbi:hypothetical protein DICVIV_03235 [Dictyocaulus viviparus]|uniref:Glycosyltransferase family 92 protein n=1 Tax=Dictyocaulus viviparus TaxID=29172 RepID=A0A0D8Y7I5_DICVI|nr:hypothetical protein DICVIV_03235 [Dictyocaulus viviparus]
MVAWNNETNLVTHGRMERITPHNVCRWISIFMTTPLLPNLQGLALSVGNKLIEIPFREPVLKQYDVVTCIAPLFGSEQWQQALLAAHVYRRLLKANCCLYRFGTHMHLYVRSMVSPVYKLLKIYEEEGYLTIQPWLRITLRTISELQFNPNVNVEFRNQAAAQTDCLLQYKESASYIALMDLDDLLIPRMGDTYLEEFAHLFNSMPNVAYLHYGKENTKLKAVKTATQFNLMETMSSIQFVQVSETGKVVADPRYLNTTWIHFPVFIAKGMERYNVPLHVNAITHHKHVELFNLMETMSSIQFVQVSETGKVVADPRYLNTTWIHFPVFIAKGMERYNVPLHVNAITHLKHVELVTSINRSTLSQKVWFLPNTVVEVAEQELIEKRNINEIQKDFERMRNRADVAKILPSLPTSYVYLKAIAQCFQETFYKLHYSGRNAEIKCPGPDRCLFPRGVPCYNSVAEFHSIDDGSRINLHFATDAKFTEQDGCQP